MIGWYTRQKKLVEKKESEYKQAEMVFDVYEEVLGLDHPKTRRHFRDFERTFKEYSKEFDRLQLVNAVVCILVIVSLLGMIVFVSRL